MSIQRLSIAAFAIALLPAVSVVGFSKAHAQTIVAFAGLGEALDTPRQGLVQKADIFRKCQEMYWCGLRRDGTARCGPTVRCATCRFVRTCSRSLGCLWKEKCKWGPYTRPVQN